MAEIFSPAHLLRGIRRSQPYDKPGREHEGYHPPKCHPSGGIPCWLAIGSPDCSFGRPGLFFRSTTRLGKHSDPKLHFSKGIMLSCEGSFTTN